MASFPNFYLIVLPLCLCCQFIFLSLLFTIVRQLLRCLAPSAFVDIDPAAGALAMAMHPDNCERHGAPGTAGLLGLCHNFAKSTREYNKYKGEGR